MKVGVMIVLPKPMVLGEPISRGQMLSEKELFTLQYETYFDQARGDGMSILNDSVLTKICGAAKNSVLTKTKSFYLR